jgi:hypothetical protein
MLLGCCFLVCFYVGFDGVVEHKVVKIKGNHWELSSDEDTLVFKVVKCEGFVWESISSASDVTRLLRQSHSFHYD